MASKKYFGTDGIRNTANRGPLTPGFILRLGRVIGRALRDDPSFFEPAFFEPAAEVPAGGGKPIAVVARDSRISGDMIESALVAGLLAEGIDVKRAGILSTPALARVAYRASGAAAGFMISASHNPYPDNGIKVFGPGGFKISEQTELLIESAVDAEPADAETGPTGGAIGTAADARELRREYEDYILILKVQAESEEGPTTEEFELQFKRNYEEHRSNDLIDFLSILRS